jgi:hypothetical protein
MKENKNPFDEHFHRRLSDLESPVPNDLFDRLQARRGGALPSDAPLRERLEGHESPVSEQIFETILAERERRKRRRVLFWRSTTAIAALLVLGLLFTQLSASKTKNIVENASNMSAKGENTEGGSADSEGQKTVLNTPNISGNDRNTEGGEAEFKNQNLEIAKPDNTLLSKNLSVNKPTSGLNNNRMQKANVALKTTKAGVITPSLGVIRQNTEGGQTALAIEKSELDASNLSIKNQNTEGVTPNSTDKNLAVQTALENRLTPNDAPFSSSLDFLNTTLKTIALPIENRKNPCADPGNGCPTFGLKRRRGGEQGFYLDAFVAPEYMARSFKTHLPENEKLLAARDSVEKTQYAVSAGLRASFVMRNGLALRAGIAYNQMNERAQFDSLGTGSITTTYKVNKLPNGQLDTVSVTTTIVDGIFRKTRYNHYRSIDIPLQLGYEMGSKNGWTFGFNGGININISAWQKADIVGADLRQLTVSSGINAPNPVFRTHLAVSAIGSIAAYRQLTRGLQLVIEPSVRYGLQPITRVDYGLKQQYSTAGLIVGLRLKL